MDLKEFIKSAMVDIVTGVEDAKTELGNQQNHICPPMGPAYADKFSIALNGFNGLYYQQIEFDIAVTAENKSDNGAKAGIKVLGLEANLGSGMTSNNSTLSRIKFHVPLGLSSRKNNESESKDPNVKV